jgi:hypothetical protein
MEPLRRAGEHAGRGPLPGPKSDRGQRAFILARQLGKISAVALRQNAPGKKLEAGNPDGGQLGAPRQDLAGFQTGRGDSLSGNLVGIVALSELGARGGIQGMPEVGHGRKLESARIGVEQPI